MITKKIKHQQCTTCISDVPPIHCVLRVRYGSSIHLNMVCCLYPKIECLNNNTGKRYTL